MFHFDIYNMACYTYIITQASLVSAEIIQVSTSMRNIAYSTLKEQLASKQVARLVFNIQLSAKEYQHKATDK
jgi:hypothetical protein